MAMDTRQSDFIISVVIGIIVAILGGLFALFIREDPTPKEKP